LVLLTYLPIKVTKQSSLVFMQVVEKTKTVQKLTLKEK